MADTGIREKVIGVEEETTRMTLKNASRWIAPESSSEFQLDREYLEDNGVRDIKEKYPSVDGRVRVSGSIANLPVEQGNNFGVLLNNVLGKNAGAGSDKTNGVYEHVFTPATSILHPTLSFHVDRGAVLGVKGYNACLITKMTLTQAFNERLMMNADVIGINEASGTIGSPSFSDPNPFTFDQISTLKLGGTEHQANITNFTLNINNNGRLKEVLDGNAYASDVICTDGIMVDGTIDIIFESVTERDKFVAGTVSDFVITYIGDVVAGGITYKLIFDIHKVEYTAFPFGENDGLFGSSIAFRGVYSTGDTQTFTATVWNTQSATYEAV